MVTTITDREFAHIQQLLQRWTGIRLTEAKKQMVCGRLQKRLQAQDMDSFGAYFELLASGRAPDEVQAAIDLLTTHETYFFREQQHFDFLAEYLKTNPPRNGFKVWSAACSSGEEPYTIAMVLDQVLASQTWEIMGSDISAKEIVTAQQGHYPMERTKGIPTELLKRYCLKGVGAHAGRFAIDPVLRRKVSFQQINLTEPLPQVGPFEAIFLRNVLIYFEMDMKRKIVGGLLGRLRPGGLLFVGHSESLNGLTEGITAIRPSVYRKGGA